MMHATRRASLLIAFYLLTSAGCARHVHGRASPLGGYTHAQPVFRNPGGG